MDDALECYSAKAGVFAIQPATLQLEGEEPVESR